MSLAERLAERRIDLRVSSEQVEILRLLRQFEGEGMSRREASLRAVEVVNDLRREPNVEFRRFLQERLRKDG